MRKATLIRAGLLALLAVAAELACRTGLIGRFTMIPPSQMVTGLWHLLAQGELDGEIGATLLGVASAAFAAVLVGFALGCALHALPRLRRCLDPVLATYYAIPIYVLYPMFLVLFGMNRMPIVFIGFMFAVVGMMTSTLNGLDRVPPVLLKAARVLRMSRVRRTMKIVLPCAAPYVFGGVKLAIAYAFVGVLGAEFILSGSGLGYQIALAFNNFDNRSMYALILFVVLVVASVNSLFFAWEHRLLRRRAR